MTSVYDAAVVNHELNRRLGTNAGSHHLLSCDSDSVGRHKPRQASRRTCVWLHSFLRSVSHQSLHIFPIISTFRVENHVKRSETAHTLHVAMFSFNKCTSAFNALFVPLFPNTTMTSVEHIYHCYRASRSIFLK